MPSRINDDYHIDFNTMTISSIYIADYFHLPKTYTADFTKSEYYTADITKFANWTLKHPHTGRTIRA